MLFLEKYLHNSKKGSTFAADFRSFEQKWCHRLSVRTRDFHSLKRGSIPRGTTNNDKV